MILDSNESADEKVNDPNNLVNLLGLAKPAIQHLDIRKFRFTGSKGRTIPKELRPIIAAVAHVDGSTKTAREFGISEVQANELKHGRGSVGHPNAELKRETGKILDNVKELAAERLLAAVGLLDDDRLAGVQKAAELSAIAANLSRVVEKVTPKETHNPAIFHVYAPQLKSLDKYEVVEAETTTKLERR